MNTTAVHTDIATLSTWFDLSKLPSPQRVQWQQSAVQFSGGLPAPTDYYVLVVLEYDQAAAPLLEKLGLTQHTDVYVEDDFLAEWLPQTVHNSFERTPEGYLHYQGAAYNSSDLLLPPIGTGYIFAVESYIVLYGATL